ncbi:MAG: 2Fe-2S iron-sulfur cluster binding domain-containing protein [Burkholderiaceae bacterium]|nr:2Fe-2S iron-sulfur cluster binding domain-containing protein [Burkholderiaceae bacterium]
MGHRIHIDGSSLVFEQDTTDTVLRAALRAGIGFPYECNSGGCGSCRFEIVSGGVDVLWPGAPGLTERDRRKGRQLACQCRATGVLTIRVRPGTEYLPRIAPRRRPARLIGSTDVTHDIREFRFATDAPADFTPGQYASLKLDGVAAPRAYSMSNLPNAQGQWDFQIRRVPGGQATAMLFDRLAVGDRVEIDAPYGLAGLREDNPRDIVCVAGGSGLAPMVSIARGAAAAGMLASRRLHFFYGARTPRDVCGDHFLRELPGFGASLQFHPVVSDTASADAAGWPGDRGFVHEALPRVLGDSLAGHEFYFAGPPAMTQALQELLMGPHRVPYPQIHFDRFF